MNETTFEAHENKLQGSGTSNFGAATAPEQTAHSQRHSEGRLTRAIEDRTARLPSDLWLMAAGGSIAASLFLEATDHKQKALFVGQWAPTFLLLGIYNKLVKLHGSD